MVEMVNISPKPIEVRLPQIADSYYQSQSRLWNGSGRGVSRSQDLVTCVLPSTQLEHPHLDLTISLSQKLPDAETKR
jgi:hypothetical protein